MSFIPARGATPCWSFACQEQNDLYQAIRNGGTECPRFATAAEAVQAAAEGAGVLILADGYPEKTTVVEPAVFEQAARKNCGCTSSIPRLPDMAVGPPKQVRFERGVVASRYLATRCRRCGS